ncbi:MAG: hypothetical protein EAY66_04630 [Sphingobacteriales bacterium]|jgi:hypothetical protein|nr:MAG: hypothetical protein EAY66_04630 [Sphingobacteriales bacterium]
MENFKVSVNNVFGRVMSLLIGSSPICFYFTLWIYFEWNVNVSFGVYLYCLLSIFFLVFFIKFGCLDWDFYVLKEKGYLFKRISKTEIIDINLTYTIDSIFFASFYLNVFLIKFDNGQKFYFRYNLYKMPVVSFKPVIEKINKTIMINI